jgi:hypothetical protein
MWHKELGLDVRKELAHYCAELNLINPRDVINPSDQVVVNGLQLHDGNKCVVLGCKYICAKESTAMVHGRGHGWTKGKPRTWEKTHVQVCSIKYIDVDILRGAKYTLL